MLEALKNSGERRERVDLAARTGRINLLIYYGGTSVVSGTAIALLT